jgi:hypothetical protein
MNPVLDAARTMSESSETHLLLRGKAMGFIKSQPILRAGITGCRAMP